MSQVFNMFADSYLKNSKLKRPELFNFNQDDAFGANMVHGSESQNPWANRNNENAKYGYLGGTQPVKQVTAQQATSANMPGVGGGPSTGPSSSTFNNLMAGIAPPITKYGSEYLAGSGLDLIKGLFKPEENPAVKESISRVMENMLTGQTPMSGTERIVSNFLENTPVKSGVEKAVENFGNTANVGVETGLKSFDPTSLGVGLIDPVTSSFTGSKTLGAGLGAAGTTGLAAAQGFANPLSDFAALMSLFKFGSKLFG